MTIGALSTASARRGKRIAEALAGIRAGGAGAKHLAVLSAVELLRTSNEPLSRIRRMRRPPKSVHLQWDCLWEPHRRPLAKHKGLLLRKTQRRKWKMWVWFSKLHRSGKPQVLVHVSTCQGNPFWNRFSEPQPCVLKVLQMSGFPISLSVDLSRSL